MDEMLARAQADVAALAQRAVYALSDADLQSWLDASRAMSASLAALEAALAREVVGRGIPQALGFGSAGTWLRHAHRMSKSEAATVVKLGELCAARDRLGEAVASGAISKEQALTIGDTVTSLATTVDATVAQAAEARLLEDAITFGPADLRVLGERVLAHVAPDIAEAEERRQLEEAEKRACADRSLRLIVDRATQRTRISGTLTAEMGAIVAAALAPISKRRPRLDANLALSGSDPRVSTPTPSTIALAPGALAPGALTVGVPAGALAVGALAAGVPMPGLTPSAPGPSAPMLSTPMPGPADGSTSGVAADGCLGNADVAEHAVDDRTTAQRRADALVEICRHVLGCGQPDPGPQRSQAAVTVSFDALAERLGEGMLDTGQRVTPESARRMTCDAAITPAVMGSEGQVLDLGRTQRLWTGPTRRAVIIRDRGCVFPACDRPPQSCDVHHVRHWSAGGRTDLDNGALLCGFHHHLIHHTGWQIRMGDDRLPEVIPPSYVDPLQRPMRNHRHRLSQHHRIRSTAEDPDCRRP